MKVSWVNSYKPPVMGFESGKRKGGLLRNIEKLAAMIPVIGMVLGLFRMGRAVMAGPKLTSNEKIKFFGRGFVEMLNLGALLLIPDLLVTIGRACKSTGYGEI